MIFPHSTHRNAARAPQSRARPPLTSFFPINRSLNTLRCDSTISSSPTPPCFRGPRGPFLPQDNAPKKLKNIWSQNIRTGGPAVHGITNLIPSTWHSCTQEGTSIPKQIILYFYCFTVHFCLLSFSPTYALIYIIKILSQAVTLIAYITPTCFDPYGSPSGSISGPC